MAEIPFLTLAALTRDVNNAGSGDRLNLTINVGGTDVAIAEFVAEHSRGQGLLRRAEAVVSFESTSLTQSSVRIGTRGDDAWAPRHILLIGQGTGGRVVAIAMETDISRWLSTDVVEGALTLPLRLLAPENPDTPIRRLLMLVRTADRRNAGTDSLVQLQIVARGRPLFSEVITDTSQDDMERGVANWYEFAVPAPFTLHELQRAGAEVTLTMLGDDAWLPASWFLFGMDTDKGRPSQVIALARDAVWNRGWLSADEHEGSKVVRFSV